MTTPPKPGALLMDLGGPRSLEEVGPFMEKMLAHPAIFPLPPLLRKAAARSISMLRTRKVQKRYAAIGGKSPIHDQTQMLCERLGEKLGSPWLVRHGFCHCQPSIEIALTELAQQGATSVVGVPNFPQFSKTTSGACGASFRKAAKDLGMRHATASSWPENDRFVETMGELARAPCSRADHALLVAHGLPESHIKGGDPYVSEVKKTAQRLGEALGKPWSLAFQSRLGPTKWVGPYLDDEIRRLGKKGCSCLAVAPISFGCENLETLFDLDIQARELAHRCGIKSYERVQTPAAAPSYALLLKEVVQKTSHQGGFDEVSPS